MPKVVDHEQRRDEVAAVASRVLITSGVGSTIRDVAAAGGWSTTMVTHYFASKDELLLHTLALSVRGSSRAIDEAKHAGVDELRAIIEQTLPLDEERADRWRLWMAFWGNAIGSDELAAMQRERQEELVALFKVALRRRGHSGDADFEARRMMSLLDGVSVQAIFAPDRWPPERQLAQFVDVFS